MMIDDDVAFELLEILHQILMIHPTMQECSGQVALANPWRQLNLHL